MADKPMLFSTPMVRALLRELRAAGTGKTQTRRLINPQPTRCDHSPWRQPLPDGSIQPVDDEFHPVLGEEGLYCGTCGNGIALNHGAKSGVLGIPIRVRVGDRLWVKEGLVKATTDQGIEYVTYAADHLKPWWAGEGWQWKRNSLPSMHMPRIYSRLVLTVTDVRVQRLQEISEADAVAEGVERESADPPFYYVPGIDPVGVTAVGVEEPGGRHASRSYGKLMDYLHGDGFWASNPWVAAYTFTVEGRT